MRKLHGTGTLVIKSSPEKAWDFIAKPSNWSRLSFMKKVNASIPSGKVAPGNIAAATEAYAEVLAKMEQASQHAQTD